MNYIAQTFTYVRTAVYAGWGWFQDILDAVGIPWPIFLATLVGFAVVGYIISIAMSYFRGTDAADSVVSRRIYDKAHKDHEWKSFHEID